MGDATVLSGYFSADTCSLGAFEALTARELKPEQVPLAAGVSGNIPIYDMNARAADLSDADACRALMEEWADVLMNSAGAIAIKGAMTDLDAIDDATRVYEEIIVEERAASGGGADHFAAAGANDRIWNSAQKLCAAAPDVFAAYFGAPVVDAVCRAWLGPNYQMTAQVNLVRPGGKAQQAHRDYHLGFQTAETSELYPAHVHKLSPVLTLQGAIAHTDMPIESGPTKLLPFSQLFEAGYTAWRRDDFRALFEERHVQIPLNKGDALFFNPALFHAAGENRTQDIHRMANLLQISSAFGRAMETLDRAAMSVRLYPVLRDMMLHQRLSGPRAVAAIAACAEGYPFPTNLDTDPPAGGLAPESQADLFRRALTEGWASEKFAEAVAAQEARREA
ncbi:MAG: phytanoyl-CoA dioxygenase family protein [Pseudomonadota bacterium]